jgi:hypothetical protein
MPEHNSSRYHAFVVLLSFAVVAGMAIAIVLVLLWRSHNAMVLTGAGLRAAIALCPAFLLVEVMGSIDETMLSLIITSGAIIVANAAMYGGVAAFAYWIMTTFARPRS